MNIPILPHISFRAHAAPAPWGRALSACALLAALLSVQTPAIAQALTIDDFSDGNATLEVPAMPLPASGSLQIATAASVPGGWRTLALTPTAGSSALAFMLVDNGSLTAYRLAPQSLYVSFGYGQSAPMNLDLSGQNALRLDLGWAGASTSTGWDGRALDVTVYATTSIGAGLNPDGSAARAVLTEGAPVDIAFASFATNSATGTPVNWADVDGLLFVVSERNPGASGAGFGLNAISAVPEPATAWLGCAALIAFALGSLRKSKLRLRRLAGPAARIGVAAALLAAGPGHANLLTNGSFEAGSFTPDANGVQQLGLGAPGPLPLAGWTLFVGDVFWVGTPNAYGISSSDGSRSMSLYDPIRPLVRVGSVQQTVASTIGTTYELSFDIGANNNFLRPTGVRVQAAGQAADFYNTGAADWQRFSWTFTANDTSTVIYFAGLFGDGYIGLDNAVLVAAAVPEPGTWALLAAGLVGVAWRRRRAALGSVDS